MSPPKASSKTTGKTAAKTSPKTAPKPPSQPSDTPRPLRVLSVASEMYPFVKTGGLADVVGALPEALRSHNVAVTTIIPGYRSVLPTGRLPRPSGKNDLITLAPADSNSGAVLAVHLPEAFDREGGPYLDETGRDHPDNLSRFSHFSQRAAEIAAGFYQDLPAFDLIHAHDWQAAAVVGHVHHIMKGAPLPTVFTIHNLAFQGRYGGECFQDVGLPAAYFDRDWFEFYGDVSLLKSAVLRATKVTTVSETYAAEICGPAQGFGLNELLAGRGSDLVGLVNGLDTGVWNPGTDAALPQTYTARTAKAGKAAAKAALQAQFGLEARTDKPLFGLVSRLSDQKGIDLIAEHLDALVFSGAQVAVLGSGDPGLAAALAAKTRQHPTQIGFTEGYNEALSHLIHAAADFLLVPSRFEPCGLTQLSAQRYGAVPIVSPVGGLVDTVIDANPAAQREGVGTGIILRSIDAAGMSQGLNRALTLYQSQPDALAQMVQNGMAADVGWNASATGYAALYRSLI